MGIYGVILGTILADILTNLAIDPVIIHRYSFNNYKPVTNYYKKNFLYIAVLVAVGALDMWLCSWLFIGHGWLSVLFHIIIVALSVPSVYIILYWKTRECQYLRSIINRMFLRMFRKSKDLKR